MDAWAPEENTNLNIGKRRAVPKRRMAEKRPVAWTLRIVAVLLVLALGGTAFWWFHRPTGLAAMPNPAIISPGGFRSAIQDGNVFTVGLSLRNSAENDLTITSAQVIAPPGLQSVGLSLLPAGPNNTGFELSGELRKSASVTLAPGGNAVLVARYQVTCGVALASAAPTDEQIFVTIKVGAESREEEISVPVVGELPWLTATAQRACVDPVTTASPGPPLPPLPDPTKPTS